MTPNQKHQKQKNSNQIIYKLKQKYFLNSLIP